MQRGFVRTAILLAAVFVTWSPAQAQQTQEISEQLAGAGAPAAGVALSISGETECSVAGIRAAGYDVPVERGDLWHVGSITKSMTATLAARLVERNEIAWTSTVGETLGQRIQDIHPNALPITLEQLLSHQSGLPANLGTIRSLQLILQQRGADLTEQRAAYAQSILRDPPEALPGSSFTYSNAGYVIAGLMLESVTNTAWEDLMQAEVFDPLGLDSAGFGPPGTAGEIDQPRGHSAGLFGRLSPTEPGNFADNPAAMGPAGTVHISLCDLLTYGETHANRPGTYLSPGAWDALHRLRKDDYALGWYVMPNGGLSHAGSNTLWFARISIWPEENRAVAVVTNDGRVETIAKPVAEAIEALSP